MSLFARFSGQPDFSETIYFPDRPWDWQRYQQLEAYYVYLVRRWSSLSPRVHASLLHSAASGWVKKSSVADAQAHVAQLEATAYTIKVEVSASTLAIRLEAKRSRRGASVLVTVSSNDKVTTGGITASIEETAKARRLEPGALTGEEHAPPPRRRKLVRWLLRLLGAVMVSAAGSYVVVLLVR